MPTLPKQYGKKTPGACLESLSSFLMKGVVVQVC